MATALYDPDFGFYSAGPAIGRPTGPFNTNAMFPAFGYALAHAVENAEAQAGNALRVVEIGGGTGELATHIRTHLAHPHEYVIVETSPQLRQAQRARGFTSLEHMSALPPAPTVMLANEVLDALPVHRVMTDGAGIVHELYVDLDSDGDFYEVPCTPSTPGLAARLEKTGIRLGRGHIAEICLDFDHVLEEIARVVQLGYVIFIDYGDEPAALYASTRRNGNLRCFRAQQQTFDPFDFVGEQDVTADVDFAAVRSAAMQAGLFPAGTHQQGDWLKNLGIDGYLRIASCVSSASHEIDQLTNVAQLGSTFDVHMYKTPHLPDGPGLYPKGDLS